MQFFSAALSAAFRMVGVLVLQRLALDLIDDQHLHGPLYGIQLQPELLIQRFEQRKRSARVRRFRLLAGAPPAPAWNAPRGLKLNVKS